MRKTYKPLSVFAVTLMAVFLIAATGAFAHEMWVNADEPKDGVLNAVLGYGHTFPEPEAIAEDRLHIFKPLTLVAPSGSVEMEQKGEHPYDYQAKTDLKKGTVLVLGEYRPTFWSNGEGGWKQTDRKTRPDATYVEEAIMYGKTILNIGGAMDEDLIAKPVGQRLEIVPQTNPAKLKAGEKFRVQVLVDGEPLKIAQVFATFGGFSHDPENTKAFVGKTDLRGMIDIIPLKHGYWYAKVTHKMPHADKTVADEIVMASTLSFHIGQ